MTRGSCRWCHSAELRINIIDTLPGHGRVAVHQHRHSTRSRAGIFARCPARRHPLTTFTASRSVGRDGDREPPPSRRTLVEVTTSRRRKPRNSSISPSNCFETARRLCPSRSRAPLPPTAPYCRGRIATPEDAALSSNSSITGPTRRLIETRLCPLKRFSRNALEAPRLHHAAQRPLAGRGFKLPTETGSTRRRTHWCSSGFFHVRVLDADAQVARSCSINSRSGRTPNTPQ